MKRPTVNRWNGVHVRPVVDRDGRKGQCEVHRHFYRVKWEDGTTQEHVDISYLLAKFTDVKSLPSGPNPIGPLRCA